MNRLHCLCLTLGLLVLATQLCAQPAPSDPDLAAGMRSVEAGDFETALTSLGVAVRTLAAGQRTQVPIDLTMAASGAYIVRLEADGVVRQGLLVRP